LYETIGADDVVVAAHTPSRKTRYVTVELMSSVDPGHVRSIEE
jgi:hypothetical protein